MSGWSRKPASKRVDGIALAEQIGDLEFAVRDAQTQDGFRAALGTLKAFLEGMTIREREAVWRDCGITAINSLVYYFALSPDDDEENWGAIDRFFLKSYWPVYFDPEKWRNGKPEAEWRDELEKAEANYSDCLKLAEQLPWEEDFFKAEAGIMKKKLLANGQKEFASREEAQRAMETALSDILKHCRYKWGREEDGDAELPAPFLVMHVTGRGVSQFADPGNVLPLLQSAGFGEFSFLCSEGDGYISVCASFLSKEDPAGNEDLRSSECEGGRKKTARPSKSGARAMGMMEPDALKIALGDYLETKDGQRTMAFFRDFETHFRQRFETAVFGEFVGRNLDCPDRDAVFRIQNKDSPFDLRKAPPCERFEDFCGLCESLFDSPGFWADARGNQSLMPLLSCQLFAAFPQYAFPYLLPVHFYKAKEIFLRLGIPLPEMPGRNDHEGRCRYLLDLFVAAYQFRKECGFSPEEFCCLLYGYAPRFLVSYVNTAPVPANRVCIVGATKEDAESDLQNPKEGDISIWQGNAAMTPGDIVLVYETSPYCRISTIWRAVSPGYDDPFDYFSGKVVVGHPMKIPPISFGELAADPVWGRKGLVKGHMIGVSGHSCSVEEYEALKAMIHRKDPSFPLGTLPMPPEYAQFFHEDIKVERDVEVQLLEPLLGKLGFKESDWVRQLELRMGRGDRVFPDYAIGVTGDKNNRAAEFVWEAKYRIPSSKQLEIDFGQAKSYALRLQSKALGLVALEGVWVVGRDSGFNFRKLVHYSWKDLENPETLSKLKQLFRKG